MRKKSVPSERPMVSYMSVLLAVEDVGSRRLYERPQAAAAELLRRGPRCTGPFGQPGRGVGPPGARLGLGALEPLGRIRRVVLVHLEAGLRVARRVDQRRDVPARR